MTDDFLTACNGMVAEAQRKEREAVHRNDNARQTLAAALEHLLSKTDGLEPELAKLLTAQLEYLTDNLDAYWGDATMPWRIVAEAFFVLELIGKGELTRARLLLAQIASYGSGDINAARHKENRADKAYAQEWARKHQHRFLKPNGRPLSTVQNY
jgi:hypothetical protein